MLLASLFLARSELLGGLFLLFPRIDDFLLERTEARGELFPLVLRPPELFADALLLRRDLGERDLDGRDVVRFLLERALGFGEAGARFRELLLEARGLFAVGALAREVPVEGLVCLFARALALGFELALRSSGRGTCLVELARETVRVITKSGKPADGGLRGLRA
jgi:hypothetical protein